MFSCALDRLHVFPRQAPAACFSALWTGCMFSRALDRLHVFPRFGPVACFSALWIGYMFSRALDRLHVFPRQAPAACLPALGAGCSKRLQLLLLSSDFLSSLQPFNCYCALCLSDCWRSQNQSTASPECLPEESR